jgi:two-component system LytT family response regulator
MIKAMIVDDEPLARLRVRDLLAAHPDVSVVAEAGDGEQAEAEALRHGPDLLLLDVQMPGVNGFQALERLRGLPRPPYVIFTTAHDQYALKAFEFAAVDYLLKPLDAKRFDTALARAREALAQSPRRNAEFEALLEALKAGLDGPVRAKRFSVKVGTKVRFLDPEQIEHVAAEGDYVAVHLGKESLLVRERLRDLEAELAGYGLVRVHRSTMVNAAKVREIRPNRNGEYDVVMESGKTFATSAAHRAEVEGLMRR